MLLCLISKITFLNLGTFRHLSEYEMIKYFYRLVRKTKTHKKSDNHVYHLCIKLKTNNWFHWKLGQLQSCQLHLSEMNLKSVTEQAVSPRKWTCKSEGHCLHQSSQALQPALFDEELQGPTLAQALVGPPTMEFSCVSG